MQTKKIELMLDGSLGEAVAPLLKRPWKRGLWLNDHGVRLTFERPVVLPDGLKGEASLTPSEDGKQWYWAVYAGGDSADGYCSSVSGGLAAIHAAIT